MGQKRADINNVTQSIEQGNYLVLKINNQQTRGLLDCGSCRTIIKQSFADKLKLNVRPVAAGDRKTLYAAQGSKLHIVGYTTVEFNISGLIFLYEACVISNIDQNVILGLDLLEDHGIILDFANSTATIRDSLLHIPIYNPNKRDYFVRTTKTTVIPPLTECLVDVKVSTQFANKTCMLQPVRLRQFKDYAVANSINLARGNHSVCGILNYQQTPIVIPKNKIIALASVVNDDDFLPVNNTQHSCMQPDNSSPSVDVSRDELEEFVADYGLNIGTQLTDTERVDIMRLLYKYRAVFARSIADTKIFPHYTEHIQLKPDARPFHKRQFRLKPQDAAALHQQIVELEQSGMIENCTDPTYQTPVFGVVRKGSSTPRLVQDMRLLNESVVVKTVSSNPIHDTLQNIASQRANIFTCVDLKNSFWSVGLDEASRKYTAFQDPLTFERKQWCVTPMGYVNSSAALHTVMNHVFAQEIGTLKMHTYADDILTCSHDFASHYAQLDELFAILLQTGLRISPSKASIATDSCVFLSHRLSAEGILPTEDHIKLIQCLPVPSNKKSLMRFLGTVNWLKAFVPQLSQRTFHLRQLLRDQNAFVWSPECQQEFDSIKAELISPRVLHPIDSNSEWVFFTDASKFGMAYAACQVSADGKLQLIGFGGNSLTAAQARSWPSVDLELAAVCSAISQYACFLHGKTTHIVSDNLAVCHLKSLKLQSARIRKMVVFLNQFSLTVRHIKGTHNNLADCLSRCFADMSEPVRLEFAVPKPEIDDFIFKVSTGNVDPTDDTDRMTDELDTDANDINRCRQTGEGTDCELRSRGQPSVYAVQTRMQRANDVAANEPRPANLANRQVNRWNKSVGQPRDSSRCSDEQDKGTDASSTTHMSLDPPPSADRLQAHDDDRPLIHITPEDYYADDEFRHVYTYLRDGRLSDDDSIDRHTLLIAENFFYELNTALLYKIALPTRRKQKRVTELTQTLCVPLKYRLSLLAHFHDQLGHFSHERLFLRLHEKYFWKSQFKDARDYSISCDRCQQTKRDYKPGVPLHPHETPSRPFEIIHFDLKNLTRSTGQGNKYLLVAVDAFSKYPFIEALPDSTALTCAKALVKIVAFTGVPRLFVSDRASYWTSQIMKILMELLQVKHRIASSLNPQSNGAAERMIQSVAGQIRLLADSDLDIENVIPLILINLRSAVNPTTQKSSHEIVFGSPMQVPNPLPVNINSPSFQDDQAAYLNWLKQKLKFIHDGISENLTETKVADAIAYNKRHHAAEPKFKAGDEVYLLDRRIKPRSDQVITHRNYSKRYIIVEKVESPNTGPAYRVADIKTGQTLKSLVAPHRLKLCLGDLRADLQQRLSPALTVGSSAVPASPTQRTVNPKPTQANGNPVPTKLKLEPAIKILKQQKRGPNGEMHYLVLFTNKSKYWCDRVTPLLLRDFRMRQAALRKHRQPNRPKD